MEIGDITKRVLFVGPLSRQKKTLKEILPDLPSFTWGDDEISNEEGKGSHTKEFTPNTFGNNKKY